MAAADFTNYIIDKANDVIDVFEEFDAEITARTSGTSIDSFIDEATAAFRDYLVSLVPLRGGDLD